MRGERVSIAGLDGPAAELMVNLVTGAAVPDQGDIWIFGRRTADIATADDWLSLLARLRIVRRRLACLARSLRHRQRTRRAAGGLDSAAEPRDAFYARDRPGPSRRRSAR